MQEISSGIQKIKEKKGEIILIQRKKSTNHLLTFLYYKKLEKTVYLNAFVIASS